MAFKMNQPLTKVGVNGQVFDEIRRKRGDYQWPTPKDDPRLDRDHTRNAQPVDLSRAHTWADALKKRGK